MFLHLIEPIFETKVMKILSTNNALSSLMLACYQPVAILSQADYTRIGGLARA